MQADFSESLYPINGDEMIYWYKRDPNAALTGMRGLSHDAKSAYNTIIDLLYSRDGDLPDDEHFLCVQIECRPQWWRRVRAELIAAGKIWVLPDGRLMANRVETVLKEAQNFSETQSKLARKGWVSKGKPNESNAPSMPTQQQPDLHPELEREHSLRSLLFPQGGIRGRGSTLSPEAENFPSRKLSPHQPLGFQPGGVREVQEFSFGPRLPFRQLGAGMAKLGIEGRRIQPKRKRQWKGKISIGRSRQTYCPLRRGGSHG